MRREVRLVRAPVGTIATHDFAVVEAALPELGDGEVRVEVHYLSMDPVVRLRLGALPVGTVVPGRGVGRVVASRAPDLAEGNLVYGEVGWTDSAVLPASMLEVLPATDVPTHHHLNALGPTGLAAWCVVEQAAPQAGETVLIAPGAGAVGSLAAQLALHRGAQVAGTGIGAAQHAYLAGLGVAAVSPDDAELPAADVLIDGVGGGFHDRAVAALNPRGRVVLLGFLAAYGEPGPPRYGNMGPVLMKRASVHGFLLADHLHRADEARAELAALIASGVLRPAETIWDGLEQAGAAFAALFADAPPGKQLVRVRSER